MTREIPLMSDANETLQDAGFGALETGRGRLPLKGMTVDASIADLAVRTCVRQTFQNAFDEPLEATYIFPLPDRAAVNAFTLRVGDRIVNGELQERGNARETYARAIEDGYRAALAEEDRSGVFTICVGNMPPQEEITVELALVGPLPVADDEATFRFPLVVAPRYISGVPLNGPSVGEGTSLDTDAVPDASRISPPVLLPGFPNPVELQLHVDFVGPRGDSMRDKARCSLHSVVESDGRISLRPGERLNRDFILRFPVNDDAASECQPTARLSAAKPVDTSNDRGVFGLTVVPSPIDPSHVPPRDIVFVVDRSGSMRRWKMVAARRAVGRMVDSLRDEDRFSVIAFDSQMELLWKHLENGTDRNRWKALEWLGRIDARGGTELGSALVRGLELVNDDQADDRERSVVLITDGQVGAEDAVLRAINKHFPEGRGPRVFTVGVDQAVNAGFLNRLADFGRGVCELVESESRLDEALGRIHRLISTPVLRDVTITANRGRVLKKTIAPRRLPDLHPGSPTVVYGQFTGPLELTVSGVLSDGTRWQQHVTPQEVAAPLMRPMWGRAHLRDLEDAYAANGGRSSDSSARIVEVSLECGVLSRFTAFVAVDTSEVVNEDGTQQKIIQPVEIPAGWEDDAFEGGIGSALRYSSVDCAFDMLCEQQMSMPPESRTRRLMSIQPPAQPPRSRRSKPRSEPRTKRGGDKAFVDLLERLIARAREFGAARISIRQTARSIVLNFHCARLRKRRDVDLQRSLDSQFLSWLADQTNPAGEIERTEDGRTVRHRVHSSAGRHGPEFEIEVETVAPSRPPSKTAERGAFWK